MSETEKYAACGSVAKDTKVKIRWQTLRFHADLLNLN
jgi:hypothetical protein